MNKEDLNQVADLEPSCFSLPWTLSQWQREFENPFGQGVVLEEETIRGYAWFWVLDRDIQLVRIGIHPSVRHNGWGSLLLAEGMEIGRQAGCESMSLDVSVHNQPARNLYEKNGFVYSHTSRRYYSDGSDAIVYLKSFKRGDEQ